MKKKILVGSIIAVAMLVSLSFTSVIGYTTIKSDPMNASPLFNVRTNKAIGEESTGVHRQYIGNESTLGFPKRDDEAMLIKQIVNNMRRMDDETFERFTALAINSKQKDKRLNDVAPNDIRDALYLLRDSDESVIQFNTDTKYNIQLQSIVIPNCPTTRFCPLTIGKGCILVSILEVIFEGIVAILFWIALIYNFISHKLTIDCP